MLLLCGREKQIKLAQMFRRKQKKERGRERERERLLLERWVGGFSLSFTCIGWVLEHTMFFYLRLFIVIVPLAKIIMIISVSM